MRFARVLVLAPHTDDAELGCGGTIARFVEEGVHVQVAVFSKAEESVPSGSPRDRLQREFLAAISVLGVPLSNVRVYDYPVRKLSYHRQEVLEDLVRLRREFQPDLVLLPSGQDLHQDHAVVHMEGLRAFKDISVLGYELPWNELGLAAQLMITLDQRHMATKWKALSCYSSQFELGRPYFSLDFMLGWARLRGVQVRAEFAEAFEVKRLRW